MSSTITQLERRSVPAQDALPDKIVLKNKRVTFTRSASIEKLKKFNSFICSQHYYILPSLLVWLKTSQTLLTSQMEKCISYIKAMFLICTIRECIDKVKRFDVDNNKQSCVKLLQFATKEFQPVLNLLLLRLNLSLSLLYKDLKHKALVGAVYLGVFVIFMQMFSCAILIFFKIPTLGFVFLVGCVMLMSKIAVEVMFDNIYLKQKPTTKTNAKTGLKTVEERKRIRKQLNLIGKTISNVKLF